MVYGSSSDGYGTSPESNRSWQTREAAAAGPTCSRAQRLLGGPSRMIRTRARGGVTRRSGNTRAARLRLRPARPLGARAWWPGSSRHRPAAGCCSCFAAAPAIACAGTGRRQCVLLGRLCALLALVPFGWSSRCRPGHAHRRPAVPFLAVIGASCLTAGRRLRLVRELERHPGGRRRRAAGAAAAAAAGGSTGCCSAAAQLSAERGAVGRRGSVRGRGHPARGAGRDRGCTRPRPRRHRHGRRGARQLPRGGATTSPNSAAYCGGWTALQRHLRERARGRAPGGRRRGAGGPARGGVRDRAAPGDRPGRRRHALNCGHPWPYRLACRARRRRLAPAEPMPPLGLFPLPAELSACGADGCGPARGCSCTPTGRRTRGTRRGSSFRWRQELRSSVVAAAAPCGPSPSGVVGEDAEGAAAARGRAARRTTWRCWC